MSREIKFKAWNKELKSMSKPFTFGQVLNFNDKNIKSLTNEIILQFTGLKDKNGIDIYSGDFDQDGQVVRWCDNRNGWAMSIYDFPTKEHIACHCYNCDGNFELSEITKEIEIKGNIHELK